MQIDHELGVKLAPTMNAAELDDALRALANLAAARAAVITGEHEEAVFLRARMHGAARAFRVCIE